MLRPALSIIDYASVVWNLYQLGHIRSIEEIHDQRWATRIVPEFTDYSYNDRLRDIKFQSLVYKMVMITECKLIHGLEVLHIVMHLHVLDPIILSYHLHYKKV